MAVVKINILEVPEEARDELERRFAQRHGAVASQPGFLGFELLRPVAGGSRYFVYTRWESDAAFQAWRAESATAAHGGGERPKPVSTGAELLEFDVVQSAGPAPRD